MTGNNVTHQKLYAHGLIYELSNLFSEAGEFVTTPAACAICLNRVIPAPAMSMLYLASSFATSAVRLSGRSAPCWSRRVLTFVSCFLLLLLIFHCRRKMRSNSAVLGNPGDGRSGMVFCAVVHFMEAASKKC